MQAPPLSSPRDRESRNTITGELKRLELNHPRHGGIYGMFLVSIQLVYFAIAHLEGDEGGGNCDQKGKEIAIYDTSEAVKVEKFKAWLRMRSKF